MPSPFPGMDPYLERASRWHPFHTRLVTAVADLLEPLLPEQLYVSVEERTYIVDPADPESVRLPDLAVIERAGAPESARSAVATVDSGVSVYVPVGDVLRERYLEIRDLEHAEAVVTVIEVLSPTNKRPGPGRDVYLEKRGAVLSSRSSLVEIDLLRSGPRMPVLGSSPSDYSVLVSRAGARPKAVLVPFSVRDPLPSFPVPLRHGDPEAILDPGPAIRHVYERGRYQSRIDYREPPDPPLSAEDETWADELLRRNGLR